jgi:ligand-binding SRPBCC domain-containing protein
VIELHRSSRLAAPPEVVWRRARTLRGVNAELGPWLRMTGPADMPFEEIGAPVRSWLLLLGVLPVDRDDIGMVHVATGEPAYGFRERSTLLSATAWEHDRAIDPLPEGGTRVTDRVAFAPRLRALGGVQRLLVGAVFSHRHRRLRRAFGVL